MTKVINYLLITCMRLHCALLLYSHDLHRALRGTPYLKVSVASSVVCGRLCPAHAQSPKHIPPPVVEYSRSYDVPAHMHGPAVLRLTHQEHLVSTPHHLRLVAENKQIVELVMCMKTVYLELVHRYIQIW